MKAILIDTKHREVKEVEHDGTLQSLYKLIGCEMVEVANYQGTDCIYVDEEGLFAGYDGFFTIEGGHQPFAGNGLVVGTTRSGKDAKAKSTVESIRQKVTFLSRQEIARLL